MNCRDLARHPIAAVTLLGGLGAAPMSATAATVVVNSSADPGDAGTCTLRQAIVSMNTGAVTGTCANAGAPFGTSDTINFSNSLFGGGTTTITLAYALSISDNDLVIDAGSGRDVIVQRTAGAANQFSVIDAELSGGTLQLSGLTVQNGYATYQRQLNKYSQGSLDAAGGGILISAGTLVLDHCTISNNVVRDTYGQAAGGGIAALAGNVVLNSTVVTGNTAKGDGGRGGGVYVSKGRLTIANSTISNNLAEGRYGGAAVTLGIGNPLHGISAASAGITNSTISYNTSSGATRGGAAILAWLPPSVTLLNSTLACNDAPALASDGHPIPAVYIADPLNVSRFSVISSIFADTSNSQCTTRTLKEWGSYGTASPPIAEAITLAGDHNLVVSSLTISSTTPFNADTIIGDPHHGYMQNNGGLTPTHALGAGSPALDAGSNPASLIYDQRGADFARVVGKAADIGAYEDQTPHLCGSANGGSFASLTSASPNLCSSGATESGFAGTGPWAWFCVPSSGPNEFCGARVLASASLLIDNAGGTPISSAVFGQPLLLKAVVGSGSSTPTGTVTFADVTGGGFIPMCVNAALSGGETACDTTNAPIDIGVHQLQAVYNGDGTFGGASSSPGSIQINPAVTTTSIASQTPNPVDAGLPFTVVASVTVKAPSVATPQGTVEIDDTTDNLSCTYVLNQSTPGCALAPTSAGTHNLLVTYLGNGDENSSNVAGTETVHAVATTTGLTATPASLTYGQATSLQATLSFSSGLTPGGTVAFCDGGSAGDATFCQTGTMLCGNAALTATSPYTAACAPALAAGTHSITARYVGDGHFAASVSAAQSVAVAPADTSTVLSLVPSSIVLGDSVQAKAILTVTAPGVGVPSGTITVSDGGSGVGDSCTIALAATTCMLTPTSTGPLSVTAAYAGDTNFDASSSAPSALVVAKAATTTAVSLMPTGPITLGDPVTVNAHVSTSAAAAAIAAPGGTISVSDGGSGAGDSCMITLPATSCALTPTGTGSLSVTATYSGDSHFATSANSMPLTVDMPPQAHLDLSIVDDRNGYVRYGDAVHYTITLTNTGNATATSVAASGTPSVNFNGPTLQWQCTPSNGAICAATGSGATLADTVTLPASSSLIWILNVTVPTAAGGDAVQLDVTAGTATASDSDTLVIFREGFD